MNNKIKIYSSTALNNRRLDLEDIKKVFDKLKLSFFLIDGVLLGAIREKNFIKWDWDVELAIFEEEIMPNVNPLLNELFSSNFEIININPFSSFFKINFMKRGTKFSLIGLKKTRSKWRYRALFRYPAKLFDNAQLINFLGTEYLAPYPPEEMLTFIYGQWKIPKKSVKQSEYLNKNVQMPKALFFLIKSRYFITEFDNFLLRLKIKVALILFPDKREYLFSDIMLKKALSEDCTFLEIGSSDGLEMSNAIEFTNGKIEGYLIEPSVENLEKSKQRIQLKNTKYNANISYINKAVSASNKGVDYYFSPTHSNLSSITPILKYAKKRRIESTTIKEFLSRESISSEKHLVIKMDVEGAEVEILKSSIRVFSKIPRVSILFEVHPHLYKGDEMKEVLDNLFLIGFNVSYIETAWIKYPDMFVKLGVTPAVTYNNRALYSNIDNNFASTVSSKELLNIGTIVPYFTKKIVRSILIEKIVV